MYNLMQILGKNSTILWRILGVMDMLELQLNYKTENEKISPEMYFNEENIYLPFDTHSQTETIIMMNDIINTLGLTGDYAKRKLEIVLRYELPFFATNRKIVRNWLMENFMY